MKRSLALVVLLSLFVAGLTWTALAGQFVIRTPDTVLWQSSRDAVLVLHNSTDKLVSQIVLDFPGRVKVDRFITNDGVMDLQQQGTHIVLNGALLNNGFVQLRWHPGSIPPLTAVITGDEGTHTVILSDPNKWVTGPTEVEMLNAEALITRSRGGTAKVLTLKFDAPIAHASAIAIGGTIKLTVNNTTVEITGSFPVGTTVDLKWDPATAHLISGDWNDRPLYIAKQSEGITFNMQFTASSTTVTTNTPIHFTAPLTHGVKEYTWDFGDGTMATGASVTHAFTNAGQYLVGLQETEANGEIHLRQRLISVQAGSKLNHVSNNIAPAANPEGPYGPYQLEFEDEQWVSQGDDSGYWVDTYGYTVSFDASASYAPNGRIIKYQWDFGDGQTATTNTPYVTHHYTEITSDYYMEPAKNGNPEENGVIQVPVTLTVTDDQNRTSTSTTYVEFINPMEYGY